MRTITSQKLAKSENFMGNIEKLTINNTDYRRVLFTAANNQLVLMSLQPGEEIGAETHNLDQFFRFESGNGKVIMDGKEHVVSDGDAVIITQGTHHNIINTSSTQSLKLYTLYSPPNHQKNVTHKTKDNIKEEPFDGSIGKPS